ncbi:MAG: O-antigen ligase family protein [Firmicutes bacterium]|nr:O-antigen ligase family protein [Bacillota bacterium]
MIVHAKAGWRRFAAICRQMPPPWREGALAQWGEALTALYILFTLLPFLLICLPHGYLSVTACKYHMFTAAVLLYAGLSLVLVTLAVCKGYPWRRWLASGGLGRLHGSIPWIAAFLAAAFLSALCSDCPQTVWWGGGRYEGFFTLLSYGISFFLIALWARPRRIYVYALAFSTAVNSGLAWAQFAGYNPLGLYPAGYSYMDAHIRYSGEFLGTIGNADLFSAFLVLAIPVLAVYGLRFRGDKLRWPVLATAAAATAVLLRARVAAGALALALCFVVAVPLLYGNSARWRRRWFALAALAALCLAAAVFCLGESWGGFWGELAQVLHGHIEDGFGSSRILIWRKTLALVPEHWLLGGGPDTLAARLQLYFSRYVPESGVTLRTVVDCAHNEYLNDLVNLGLPALLFYLTALAVTARDCLKHYRQPAVAALALAVFAYSAQAFFCFRLCVTAPLFWLAWGLLAACLRRQERREV